MRSHAFIIVPLVALLLAACERQVTDPVTTPEYSLGVGTSGPSANGQATLPLEMYGGRQTISFHARAAEDGTVSGALEMNSRPQDIQMHGAIDCLAVNGNEAVVGGLVTRVRLGPEFPFPPEWVDVGTRFWFKVIDGGDGVNAPPDLFSDIYPEVLPVTVCGDFPFIDAPFEVAMVPIAVGNVQVKP